jgi:hypothetical protein
MNNVNTRVSYAVYRNKLLKETPYSGNTGFDPCTGILTLYGNAIAYISKSVSLNSEYPIVDWIDLCGYPTRLTINRLSSIGIQIRKKTHKFYLVFDSGREIEIPTSGRIPLWGINIRGKSQA